MAFSLQWTIHKGDLGKNIRTFLHERDISKSSLTDIKYAGGKITLNGKEVTVRENLEEGDHIQIVFPEEKSSDGMKGENIPVPIVYEDDFLIVFHKPAGMNTIPSREHPTGSLANGILGYYQSIEHHATIHIVTRLDRDTSGLVLVAKYRHIHHLLSKQQKMGKITREYEALAEGELKQKHDTINERIGRSENSIIERIVTQNGQPAITHYHVMEQYPHFAHLKLILETGRTHQIRVHLAYIGHPLVGDELYGGERTYLQRQALHCSKLSFYHPISSERMVFQLPLEQDIQKLLQSAI